MFIRVGVWQRTEEVGVDRRDERREKVKEGVVVSFEERYEICLVKWVEEINRTVYVVDQKNPE